MLMHKIPKKRPLLLEGMLLLDHALSCTSRQCIHGTNCRTTKPHCVGFPSQYIRGHTPTSIVPNKRMCYKVLIKVLFQSLLHQNINFSFFHVRLIFSFIALSGNSMFLILILPQIQCSLILKVSTHQRKITIFSGFLYNNAFKLESQALKKISLGESSYFNQISLNFSGIIAYVCKRIVQLRNFFYNQRRKIVNLADFQ